MTTAAGRVRTLRAIASTVVLRGADPDSLTSIGELVHPKNVADALRFMMKHLGTQRSAYLREFARVALVMTRHWVYPSGKVLSDDYKAARDDRIKKLERMCKGLEPERLGMTAKNRRLLRCFEDDALVGALLGLPGLVWQRHRKSELKASTLIALQVALAIQILTEVPIRRQNLVSIRVKSNLFEVGEGHSRRLHLHFPAQDVKNNIELEFQLSARTASMIDEYLKEIKPRLGRPSSPFLFPGRTGSHKCAYMLSNQIASLTAAELGVRITAHQFRHIAGFLYLKTNPGGHEVVRRLLGHKSIQTTLEFYAGMEASAAHRHYDNLLAELRSCIGSGRGKSIATNIGARFAE
jgi:integrase